MHIRAATPEDFDAIWPIFHDVVAAGDTSGFPAATDRDTAFDLWMEVPRRTCEAETEGRVAGTCYLKTNHQGPGAHVCNCGDMVARAARGRGLATRICQHSQQESRRLGYQVRQRGPRLHGSRLPGRCCR